MVSKKIIKEDMDSNQKCVGIIAMSAKPFHIGHYQLIEMASEENDEVMLFVSLSDRARKGELTISGESMREAWEKLIKPSLPANVNVIYSNVPIRSVYEYLGKKNEEFSKDVFSIYSDPEDISKSYSEKHLLKYLGNLFSNNQIILRPTARTDTTDISGTKMRDFIVKGDLASFTKYVPEKIYDAAGYWNILRKNVKSENLLRSYVKMTLKS